MMNIGQVTIKNNKYKAKGLSDLLVKLTSQDLLFLNGGLDFKSKITDAVILEGNNKKKTYLHSPNRNVNN